MAVVVDNSACLVCAAWDHNVHRFPGGRTAKDAQCSTQVQGKACGGGHGKWFHATSGSGGSHSVIASTSSQGPGLYEVYSAPVHPADGSDSDGPLPGMIMVDPGSDTNFIRQEFARSLGLKGLPCSFKLKVVDREARSMQTTKYQVEVEDKHGDRHVVDAIGLETITVLPPDPDLDPIRHLVAGYPAEVLERPQGEVDMLLGLKNSALHGSLEEEWGDLRLLKAPLGCGWSLRGCHPDLQYPAPQLAPSLAATAYMLRQVEDDQEPELNVFHLQNQPDFQSLEELGTTPFPVCLKCRGCRDCTFRRRRLSPSEQEVVARVERGMKVDSVAGFITASYPWKKCAHRMLDNQRQAQRIQETMEKHMLALGTHTGFVEEMKKAVADGKVRKLDSGEIARWHGPVNFITTFAVVKPESVSTKTRVVSNSAMKNARSGLSLNDCMAVGPNALCELYDCLIFWRAVEYALMVDLQKAYQAIHTGDLELHLRRFLFRESPEQPWEIFAFTRATFGDVSAGLVLEVAKRKVAELGLAMDPMAARQIMDYTYVDDSVLGGDRQDVHRMRGTRTDSGIYWHGPQDTGAGRDEGQVHGHIRHRRRTGRRTSWEARRSG